MSTQPPVKVKVYGLISLTRRGYMICLGVGVGMLVVLLLAWALFIAGPPTPAEQAGAFTLWTLVRVYTPLILLAAALLEGIEVYFVLRRFRRAEAERLAGAQPQEGAPQGS
jgi:membrane protein implicated in regulation of membrane protease activity